MHIGASHIHNHWPVMLLLASSQMLEMKVQAAPIGDAKSEDWFSLTPNPASHDVNFKMAEELSDVELVVFEIYNTLGQQCSP